MASSGEGFLNFAWIEIIRHRVFIVVSFVLLSFMALLVGLNWPQVYSSYTSIYVEEQNIIGPLMQGAAVPTEVIDRSSIAREILYGRKLLLKVVEDLELAEPSASPATIEKVMEGIKYRTTITGRRNLISISYQDSSPQLAYSVTKHMAELFIAESLADKARESEAAFEFIEQQAQEYKEKLVNSEEELKRFRSENIEARPGIVGEIGRRNAELSNRLDQITQELREARIRRASLMRQLSGEAEAATNFSRAEQYKTRIAELQAQLDTLRLSYHETYPDIIQLKAQIQDLRDAVARENSGGNGGSSRSIDERVLTNPLYQELQRSLYETNTLVETLTARQAQTQSLLDEQIELGKRVQDYEARLSELTRDYEVNREIYADLTRRRESARVSMNLDREHKGLAMRIDEPAYLPHKPSGLQFIHFAIAGPVLALIFPIVGVVALRHFDPRIRSEEKMTEGLGLPLLGVVPVLATPAEERRETVSHIGLGLFFLVGIALIVTVIVQRLSQAGAG